MGAAVTLMRAAVAEGAPEYTEVRRIEGPKVLVVDDENGPRQALRMLLKEDYSVHLAPDVPTALEILDEVPIQLIITDVRMPGRSGVDLLQDVKEAYPDVQVVLLTGYGELDTAVKAVEYGAYAYLEKPFDNDRLMEVARSAIEKHQAEKERRALEYLSLEANRFETLGRVLSGALHDLGSPLTVLSAQLEMLMAGSRGNNWERRVQSMQEQVRHCNEMVRSTMNFLRCDSLTEGAFDVNVAVQSCLAVAAPMARERNVNVTQTLAAGLPKVKGDLVLVRQAILNLVVNACQAMESEPGERRLAVESWQSGKKVRITIRDSGPGIAENLHERIFDTFFSTKAENGTGLGLSVVKNVMERMGGAIRLAESDGPGACFHLEFAIA